MMQAPYPGAPPAVGPTGGQMMPGMQGMPTPGGGMMQPPYPGAPQMMPGTGQAPVYATGPTPMAWQQQASTGTASMPAKKGSMLPLFIILFLVLAGGAGTLVYFFVLRDDGSKGTTTAAPSTADAGLVLASTDAGGPPTADGGTTVATVETAGGEDAGTSSVEPETTVATGPDAGPETAAETTVVATGPDVGPDVAPDTAPELVEITFITTPQQAKVFLVKDDGSEEELCQTACQYEFPKSDTDVHVVFRKNGFRDQPATIPVNDGGMVNMQLERVRSGQRDAGAREAVAMEVTVVVPDAGAPRRDARVIVVPSRDAGVGIRIEAGSGVRQIDSGVRLRDTPFGR
jgi:hypothetical protein